MADAPGRPMKYPYTYSAKIVQFPYKLYWNKVWLFKYWFVGIGLCLPLFYKIGNASYSPENVKKWEQIRNERWSGHHH